MHLLIYLLFGLFTLILPNSISATTNVAFTTECSSQAETFYLRATISGGSGTYVITELQGNTSDTLLLGPNDTGVLGPFPNGAFVRGGVEGVDYSGISGLLTATCNPAGFPLIAITRECRSPDEYMLRFRITQGDPAAVYTLSEIQQNVVADSTVTGDGVYELGPFTEATSAVFEPVAARVVGPTGTYVDSMGLFNCTQGGPGDKPTTAIPLPIHTDCTQPTVGYTTNKYPSSPPVSAACAVPYVQRDVWFELPTANVAAPQVMVEARATYPFARVEIYTGTAGNLTFVDCSAAEQHLLDASGGQTYFIRLFAASFFTGAVDVCAYEWGPPTNDTCADALVTNVSPFASPGSIPNSLGRTIGASATPTAATCVDNTDQPDSYYYLAALPPGSNANLLEVRFDTVRNQYGDPVVPQLEITPDDCAQQTLYACANDYSVFNIDPATPYRMRVSSSIDGEYIRDLRFFLYRLRGETNLTCNTAYPFPVDPLSPVSNGSTVVPTNGQSRAATPGAMVWFTFTPTETVGSIELTNRTDAQTSAPNQAHDMHFEYYTGSCAGLTSQGIVYNADSRTTLTNLQIGTTYYVRVFSADPLTWLYFTAAYFNPEAPANDACVTAELMQVGGVGDCSLEVPGTTVYADESAPACASAGPIRDVFYRFTATDTAVLVSVQAPNVYALDVEVLGAGCPGVSLACGAAISPLRVGGLTVGDFYRVRVSTPRNDAQAFTLCLQTPPPPPVNDACAAAQTLATGPAVCAGTPGTTAGATGTAQSCYGTPARDVWYRFVATGSNHGVRTANIQGGFQLGLEVYSGSCGNLTSLGCYPYAEYADPLTNLTVGQNIYLRYFSEAGTPDSQFEVCVENTDPPVNDTPTTVTELLQNPACAPVAGTVQYATAGAMATACNGTPVTANDDVWYRFTAATTNPEVTLENYGTEMAIELWDANQSTRLDCGTGYFVSLQPTALSVGTDYLLRVFSTGNTAVTGQAAEFTLCVAGLPATVAASPSTPTNCVTADQPATATGAGYWKHVLHGGELVFSFLDTEPTGLMTTALFLHDGAVRTDGSGTPYLDRNFEIDPAVQPAGPVRLRLYFTLAELQALLAADPTLQDVGDLIVTRASLGTCAAVGGFTSGVLAPVTGAGYLPSGTPYLEIEVPGFSTFHLHGGAAALPVVCETFSARRTDEGVSLRWQTAQESGNDYFAVERSMDGRSYQAVDTVAARGATGGDYAFVDTEAAPTTAYYYRLRQYDLDGRSALACATQYVAAASVNSLTALPNPATDEVLVRADTPIRQLTVYDLTGRPVQSRSYEGEAEEVELSVARWQPGLYFLRVRTDRGEQTLRLVRR